MRKFLKKDHGKLIVVENDYVLLFLDSFFIYYYKDGTTNRYTYEEIESVNLNNNDIHILVKSVDKNNIDVLVTCSDVSKKDLDYILDLKNFKEKSKYVTNNVKESNISCEKKIDEKIVKKLKILFIFTLLSFFIVISIILVFCEIMKINSDITYAFSPLSLVFLLVTILSIVYGRKYYKLGYKSDKNVIAGIIMTFVLSIIAFDSILGVKKMDYSECLKYESIISVDFPSSGKYLKISRAGKNKMYIILDKKYKEDIYKQLINNNWSKNSDVYKNYEDFLDNGGNDDYYYPTEKYSSGLLIKYDYRSNTFVISEK